MIIAELAKIWVLDHIYDYLAAFSVRSLLNFEFLATSERKIKKYNFRVLRGPPNPKFQKYKFCVLSGPPKPEMSVRPFMFI